MTAQAGHSNFAGRSPAGSQLPVTLAKNGVNHIRQYPCGAVKETLCVGLACSECFSGPRLAKLLKPGFDYEAKVMEQLMADEFAGSLSTHTSAGVSEALSEFIAAMEPHLPWKDEATRENPDWCISLQLEGASAVWAAVDMLLQERILSTGEKSRTKVAVAQRSYHGPPSTSFGSRSAIWRKHHQVMYKIPTAGIPINEEHLLKEFDAFLDEHAHEVGVLLIEPQWGSSQAALVWPKNLLKTYIQKAQSRGIRVLCDEIMCGLGRHGHGTLFISEAWDLNPDAVTFGKAIGGGVYPLAGAIVKRGKKILQSNKCSVMQSHTYAGSSTRAIMTGTAVLKELPLWFSTIEKLGKEMDRVFSYLATMSKGMLVANGQGLMWGCLFTNKGKHSSSSARTESIKCFKKHCEEIGIIPYFVPVGGFMVTPVLDIDIETINEMGQKLEEAIRKTMEEREWEIFPSVNVALQSLKIETNISTVNPASDESKEAVESTTIIEASKSYTELKKTKFVQFMDVTKPHASCLSV